MRKKIFFFQLNTNLSKNENAKDANLILVHENNEKHMNIVSKNVFV